MKKTENQAAFDAAKHGWAFADAAGLAWRIAQCEAIADRLSVNDLRHAVLKFMKAELEKLTCRG